MNSDILGNALRKYYGLFGLEGEGPPQGVNVSELFKNVDFDSDLQLIERICNNEQILRKHKECNGLVE